MPIGKRWISLTLLSVVIPVSLLVGFRLTGIFSGPPQTETFTVKAVTWNMTRPTDYTIVDDRIENYFLNDVSSVNFTIHVSSYYDDSPTYGDFVIFRTLVSANVTTGFVQSVLINFSSIDNDALLDIVADLKDKHWVDLKNLTIKVVRDSWRTDKPYIYAAAVGNPNSCSLKMVEHWMFFDSNDVDHWVTVTLTLTYFTEITYQKVIIPIHLEILAS